jgi:hypothetical protein
VHSEVTPVLPMRQRMEEINQVFAQYQSSRAPFSSLQTTRANRLENAGTANPCERDDLRNLICEPFFCETRIGSVANVAVQVAVHVSKVALRLRDCAVLDAVISIEFRGNRC